MMKKIIGFLLCVVSLASCCDQQKNDNLAYRIGEKDLIPEGITYSAQTHSFYLSSILKTKIIQIDAKTGAYTDFIPSDLLNLRFLGMMIDDTQSHLWACGNLRKDGVQTSAVTKFDLMSGRIIKSYSYNDSLAHIYNDLALDKAGNVYFTDTNAQTIYKIDQQTDVVDVFFDGNEIIHPNGISISPDNKYLYIASNDHGIRVLDIEKRVIIGEADSSMASAGIDGLKYYQNSIIGLQNEVARTFERKLVRYYLDETGTKIIDRKIIDQNNPLFEIPTTFVIVEDELFCIANSQMGNVNWEKYEVYSREALNDIFILKYSLDK